MYGFTFCASRRGGMDMDVTVVGILKTYCAFFDALLTLIFAISFPSSGLNGHLDVIVN